jgi:hypothetical protein
VPSAAGAVATDLHCSFGDTDYQRAMTLTDFLAVWGAALSTLVAGREILLSRDKLKVQLIHGASDTDGVCAVLFIANAGKRAIMVQYAGYAWPFEKLSFFQKLRLFVKYRNHWSTIGWCHTPLSSDLVEASPLPKLLEPGHSEQLWIPLASLRKSAGGEPGPLVAQVQDALGRNYYSQPVYFGPARKGHGGK